MVDLSGGTMMPLDIATRFVLVDLDDLSDEAANNGSVRSEPWQRLGDELELLYGLAVSALQG